VGAAQNTAAASIALIRNLNFIGILPDSVARRFTTFGRGFLGLAATSDTNRLNRVEWLSASYNYRSTSPKQRHK
jgi:hypothetical protein